MMQYIWQEFLRVWRFWRWVYLAAGIATLLVIVATVLGELLK